VTDLLDEPTRARAERVLAERALRLDACRKHPAYFLMLVECVDPKTGERFVFDLLDREERAYFGLDGEPGGWHWQREELDSWLAHDRNLVYKARQIGLTWLAGGLALWNARFRPGTRNLVISINEDESKKVIARIWGMWQSAPEWIKEGVILTKPSRGGDPSQEIEFTHPDLRKTTILALPATAKAGHGEAAALVVLDEYARQEYAQAIWKATFPVIDGGGRVVVISTANGVGNPETGEGNNFYNLWTNSGTMGITAHFLPWSMHPDRDQEWYDTKANGLPPLDRAEQFPLNPEDGFINTGKCWFDLAAINWYANNWREQEHEPLYRLRFVEQLGRAKKIQTSSGEWRVMREPVKTHKYAIYADTATGRGSDFSAAYVIDLQNAQWVAWFHALIDPDQFATSLHYMGKWFNDALICPEMGGGYGEPVVIALRDGKRGRPPYRKLYRHGLLEDRGERKQVQAFGFPITNRTRPLIINQLEAWIRDKEIPWMDLELQSECRTFCVAKGLPSPRAQDGCNDDRVMAAAGSLEMFRQFGAHETRRRKRKKADWAQTLYPWEEARV